MIELHYCKSGKAINDFFVNDFVDHLMSFIADEGGIYHYWISSVAVIEEIRARVAEGTIDHTYVAIFYGMESGDKREINEYGKISNWNGLTDGSDRAERTLVAMMKKWKERRK